MIIVGCALALLLLLPLYVRHSVMEAQREVRKELRKHVLLGWTHTPPIICPSPVTQTVPQQFYAPIDQAILRGMQQQQQAQLQSYVNLSAMGNYQGMIQGQMLSGGAAGGFTPYSDLFGQLWR